MIPVEPNITTTAIEAPSARSSIWVIRGLLSVQQYWIFAIIGFLFPIALWSIASTGDWVDKVFLPSPLDVVVRIGKWFNQDNLLHDIWISTYRVSAGWLLSAVIALPLGLFIGTYRPIQALLEPLMDFIRYMPAVAFIPLVMIWVGIDESSKIAIIFIGTFFQMVLMMAEDVRRVPMQQIEAAQTKGAARGEVVSLVVFQSAKPALLDTLRVTMFGRGLIWWSPSLSLRIRALATPYSRRSGFCRPTKSSPAFS